VAYLSFVMHLFFLPTSGIDHYSQLSDVACQLVGLKVASLRCCSLDCNSLYNISILFEATLDTEANFIIITITAILIRSMFVNTASAVLFEQLERDIVAQTDGGNGSSCSECARQSVVSLSFIYLEPLSVYSMLYLENTRGFTSRRLGSWSRDWERSLMCQLAQFTEGIITIDSVARLGLWEHE
jgi:hypothetical protein